VAAGVFCLESSGFGESRVPPFFLQDRVDSSQDLERSTDTVASTIELKLHDWRFLVCSDHEMVATSAARLIRQFGLRLPSTTVSPSVRAVVEIRIEDEPMPADGIVVANHLDVEVRKSPSGFWVGDGISSARVDPVRNHVEIRLPHELASTTIPTRRHVVVWYSILTLLRCHGLFALHSAAVAPENEHGLLIVGQSGCGKSTLALNLLRAGWRFGSDDSVLLSRKGDAEIVALPLRPGLQAKQVEAEADREAGCWGGRIRSSGERFALDVSSAYPGMTFDLIRPRVLVFPRLSAGRPSGVEHLSMQDAVYELLSASHITELEPSMATTHLRVMRDLAGSCRSYRLFAGPELRTDPGAAHTLLTPLFGPQVSAVANATRHAAKAG
jgi:hypothetical protein